MRTRSNAQSGKSRKRLDMTFSSFIDENDYIVKYDNTLFLNTMASKNIPTIDESKTDRFIKLFIVKGIDENTKFEIKTRKEIIKIEWVPLEFLSRNLIEEDFNTKYSNVRPFIFLLSKYVYYKQGKLENFQLLEPSQTEDADFNDSLDFDGKFDIYKRAKNCYFNRQDYNSAFIYYQKAIEAYDNSLNALEMLLNIALVHRGGVDECFNILEQFQPLFHNVNDYNKHYEYLLKIKNDTSIENMESIIIQEEPVYPISNEIAFRESISFSYGIKQQHQLFILMGEPLENANFYTLNRMKSEFPAHLKISKNFQIFRMLEFVSPVLASEYFKKYGQRNPSVMLMSSNKMLIDNMTAFEFLERENELKEKQAKIKEQKRNKQKEAKQLDTHNISVSSNTNNSNPAFSKSSATKLDNSYGIQVQNSYEDYEFVMKDTKTIDDRADEMVS